MEVVAAVLMVTSEGVGEWPVSNAVAGEDPADVLCMCPGRFFCSLVRSLPSPPDSEAGALGTGFLPGTAMRGW